MTRYQSFVRLLDQLAPRDRAATHSQPAPRSPTEEDRYLAFDKCVRSLVLLKSAELPRVVREFRRHQHVLRPFLRYSTFELMGHNFRENTHSNILKYLFDFRVNGDIGSKAFERFLRTMLGVEQASHIARDAKKRTYLVEREKAFASGRIDLLISDAKNRFVVLIENKVFSPVRLRDPSREGEVTNTQLDEYRAYIDRTYKGYRKIFTLLSYIEPDDPPGDFVCVDYRNLYRCLAGLNVKDVVLSEYRLLLLAVLERGVSKELLMSLLDRDVGSLRFSRFFLNDLEQIARLAHEIERHGQF